MFASDRIRNLNFQHFPTRYKEAISYVNQTQTQEFPSFDSNLSHAVRVHICKSIIERHN